VIVSVAALNSLYASLGSPLLPGWVSSGGDPCGEGWQGIQCNGSFIQKMYVTFFYPFDLILHIELLIDISQIYLFMDVIYN
jgi:hypothetical protein